MTELMFAASETLLAEQKAEAADACASLALGLREHLSGSILAIETAHLSRVSARARTDASEADAVRVVCDYLL